MNAPNSQTNKILFNILSISLVLLFILLCLILTETILRQIPPRTYKIINTDIVKHEIEMIIADKNLGWKLRPGQYKKFLPGSHSIKTTILPDESRSTKASDPANYPLILLTGCSFSHGWGLSDNETFAWNIQDRNPNLEIKNSAVSAYSTYQVYLFLKEYLTTKRLKPKIVLYGMLSHHENRNVATEDWLYLIKQGMFPYALINQQGQLQHHYAAPYPKWPLDQKLHLIATAKQLYMKIQSLHRENQKRKVTKAILTNINQLCLRNNIKFFVLLLDSENDKTFQPDYLSFFNNTEINSINCIDGRSALPEFKLLNDTHPNKEMNDLWATCIQNNLKDEFSRLH